MAGVGGGRTVAGGSLTIWRNDGYMLHDGWFVGDVQGEAAAVPPTHRCHGELIARQHGSGVSGTASHGYLRLIPECLERSGDIIERVDVVT